MHDRIDLFRLKQLLQSLENSEVRIRVRAIGEGWMAYCKLVLLSDSAMILQSDDERRIIVYIKNVVEFQLEEPFSGYPANTTFEVAY